MPYQIRLTRRAVRDLTAIYDRIEAGSSDQAFAWFKGLSDAIHSLEQEPTRAPITPESQDLRHLLHGKKPHVYRIIFSIDRTDHVVTVLHIRHGARDRFTRHDISQ